MPKGVKILLAILIPILVIAGGVYGAAKAGLLPVAKIAASNPGMKAPLKMLGLYKEPPKSVQPAGLEAKLPDPLKAQREAFEKEKADLEAQLQEQRDAVSKAAATAAAQQPDPKNVTRLASVYEQMDPETVQRIFAKLPEAHVQALLRKMDEKQVGRILALEKPDRAARLTLALSRPAPDAIAASDTQ